MVARTDRSSFAVWWWTIDRPLMAGFIALMVLGLVLSFAASPPVAERIGVDSYFFIKRQAMFFVPAMVVLIGTSFLSPREVRRVAMVALAVGFVMLAATLFIGQEVKGARRWINVAGMSVQPSEFVKPAFIIVVAWLFAQNKSRPGIPTNIFAFLLLGMMVALLVAQPDFGQTMLTVIAWGAVFFVAGMPILWVIALALLGVGGIFAAYHALPHVASRINRFLDKYMGGGSATSAADNYQSEQALQSFHSGGWLGRGPGEGTTKWFLPDSHTDFIFAVLGEEFGILMCLGFVSLVGFIVIRGLRRAQLEDDGFVRLSIAGLVTLFGIQSAINMAVNLHLMPAKGMTLPFVSYGGSSLIAVAFGMGCLLALTRRRPQTTRIAPPMHAFTTEATA